MTNIRLSEPVWKKVIIVTADTTLGTDRQRHLVPGSLSPRPANHHYSRSNGPLRVGSHWSYIIWSNKDCLNKTDEHRSCKVFRLKPVFVCKHLDYPACQVLFSCTYGSSSLSKISWDKGLAVWLLHPAGLLIWTSAACLRQAVSDGTQLLAVVELGGAERGNRIEEIRPANGVCWCNKVTFDPQHQTDLSFIWMWWLAASLSDWMQHRDYCINL